MVGKTYTIELDGGTATQGYNQFESFINFPNTIFQIVSVTPNTADGVLTYFQANNSPYINGGTAPVSDYQGLYADACKWENDPGSPNYRSCIGVDGKTGGAPVKNIYTVKVISGAGTQENLSSLLYDFSGSSFHYNADFQLGARIVDIVGPSSVTITKKFSPKAITPGGTSTLEITLTNSTPDAITGVHFTDTFPILLPGPYAMIVASPLVQSNTCGGSLLSDIGGTLGVTAPNNAGISLTGGSIAAYGSCKLTVNVTVPHDGSYLNETGFLYFDVDGVDTNTGNRSSDTLTAASVAACVNGNIAVWTIPSTTMPPDTSISISRVSVIPFTSGGCWHSSRFIHGGQRWRRTNL